MSTTFRYEIDVKPVADVAEAERIIAALPVPIDFWKIVAGELRTTTEANIRSRLYADWQAELIAALRPLGSYDVRSCWRYSEFDDWDARFHWNQVTPELL